MITPAYLQKGDTVGIVSTARKISLPELEPAMRLLQSWGLQVVLGKALFNQDRQFAGTDDERRDDLQEMLDQPEIKAILCARGGYGTVRIVDGLNFSQFREHPKWIIGYSDVTVLHNHIQQNFGIETLHASMPINFSDNQGQGEALSSLKQALFGEICQYHFQPGHLARNGSDQGELVGGNLSIIYSLLGSPSEIDTYGKILFLEDLDEYLYHIDRMMMALKRAGKLAHLKGLVVGAMSDMNDNSVPFGRTAEEIIFEQVKEYEYPVCFGFPAGHIVDNRALIMGRNAELHVGNTASLQFHSHAPAESDLHRWRNLARVSGVLLLMFLLIYFFIALLKNFIQ